MKNPSIIYSFQFLSAFESTISATHLTDEEVLRLEMTTEHLGRFSRHGLDFDADLLALPSRFHGLVIVLYTRYHAQVNEL